MTARKSLNRHELQMRSLVKQAMKREGIGYAQLSTRLSNAGYRALTASAVKNKINRAKFSAVFFVQVMLVLGVEKLINDNGRLTLSD